MIKKLLIPIVIAGVLALAIGTGGVAYAATRNISAVNIPAIVQAARPQPAAQALAKITAIGDNQLTVETRQGKSLTILVNENTRYHDLQGNALAFGDLQVGRWVTGNVKRDNGTLTARGITLFPANFDPAQVSRRAAGEVTAIADGGFTLHTAKGEDLAISVDSSTIYAGISNLSEMETGMKAGAGLKENEDGSLTAVLVGAHYPVIRHTGSVTAVDLQAQTLTLSTRQGEKLTFAVDENTLFVSKDDSIQGLSDITTEMAAFVGAHQLEDGSYVAVRIGAGVRPVFDLKVAGKITAINETSITIQNRDGQSYTFSITEDTRFRSRAGKVNGLDDLKIGMRIGVGANDLGDGQYQAVVVLAGKR